MKRKRLTVEDLMSTAVISLNEVDTVGRAHLEMHVASIRHIPVVDGRNHVVGILSNRDLIRALAEGRTQVPIGQIMTRTVRTVRSTTVAYDAVTMMIDGKIGSLPVVGDDEQLVGIVTETDFLAVAQQALRGLDLSSRPLEA
jgi:CBS domain-containing protein